MVKIILFVSKNCLRNFFRQSNYIFIFYHLDSEIVLSPENIATVEKGQPLTCQSNETSGIYSFFYHDAYGNRIKYGHGGGSFLLCTNSTNQAYIECEFGSSWIFRLTITHPVHYQTVYCSGFQNRQEWLTSTTIFVEGKMYCRCLVVNKITIRSTLNLKLWGFFF